MRNNSFLSLPLPNTNPAEDLETISRHKLSLIFDPSLFEIRQELQRDKGIDLIVELKQDNKYTNFRFPIQLKSTASVNANKDQSVSYPINVSNINYLLNYGMPAYYILYNHIADVFYIEQVRKVFHNLIKKYSPEKFPKHFKIRFSKILLPETIKDIYNETIETGLLFRRLNSHLNLQSIIQKKSSGILIDDENEVYNVEQNIEFINRFGLSLINQAEFKRIIEIEQRTHPRTTVSPMFNLVCGVAYFQQASLFKAIEFLKEASKEASSFEPSVKSMLIYTFLHVKRLLGIIEESEFKNEITKLMLAEDLALNLELEKSYTLFIEGEEPEKIRINTLKGKIASLINQEPDNTILRIRAYSMVLNVEEKQLINNLQINFTLLCGRVPDIFNTITYKKWQEVDELHSNRRRALLKYCFDSHNFSASNDIVSDILKWKYQKLFIFYVFKNWDSKSFSVKGEVNNEELNTIIELIEGVNKVIKGNEIIGSNENIVYALFLKYELLTFVGHTIDANETAIQIKSMIDQYDLNALKSDYYSLLNNETKYQKFMTIFTNKMNNIYRVAKNSGIGKYFKQPISVKFLEQIESTKEEKRWFDEDFFEFSFPIVNQKND